jgi:hypothetical protein
MSTTPDILAIAETGQAEDLHFELRARCDRSLYYFAKVLLGYKDMTDGFHLPLCRDEIEGNWTKKGFLLSRGHLKSTLITKARTLWLLSKDPERRFLFVGESDKVAKKNLNDIKWHIENNAILKWLYPELVPPDFNATKWTDTEITLPRQGTYDEPSIMSVGVGAKVTGFHFTDIDYDDIFGEVAAGSLAEAERVIDWVKYAPGLLVNQDTSCEVFVGTRWKHGTADVYGWVMENMPYVVWYREACTVEGKSIHDTAARPVWPERFSIERLKQIEQREGTYKFACFPSGTPILMRDWSEKSVERIEVGDVVIGFYQGEGAGRTGGLTPTEVVATGSREANLIKVTTSHGREFLCTPEHPFLNRNTSIKSRYLPAKVGREIGSVYTKRFGDYRWLSGIFDGEGNLVKGAGAVMIAQSFEAHPQVCTKLEKEMALLGLTWKKQEKNDQYNVHGGRSLKLALLPHSAKAEEIIESLWAHSNIVVEEGGWGTIVKVESAGRGMVYNFETTSHNYVANGYACHNCQYMNDPTPPEGADFPPSVIRYYNVSEDKRTCVPEDGSPSVSLSALTRVSMYDPSTGGKTASAENSIGVGGISADRRIFILDSWAKNCGYEEAIERWHTLKDQFITYQDYYELVGGQKSVEDLVRTRRLQPACQLCGAGQGTKPPHRTLKPIAEKPAGGNMHKDDRIRLYAQQAFEQGRVYIRRGMEQLRNQIVTFPHGTLVDRFDVIAYLIHILERTGPPRTQEDVRAAVREAEEFRARQQSRVHTDVQYGGYS